MPGEKRTITTELEKTPIRAANAADRYGRLQFEKPAPAKPVAKPAPAK